MTKLHSMLNIAMTPKNMETIPVPSSLQELLEHMWDYGICFLTERLCFSTPQGKTL